MNGAPDADDIRDEIFRSLDGCEVDATIEAAEPGVLACLDEAVERGRELGLRVEACRDDGDEVELGDVVLRLRGPAKTITIAEETLIGLIAKPSGIAIAARRLVEEAAGRIRIVGGAWKKAPLSIKPLVRRAVAVGGANDRMAEHPMVYLDKNYVRMLGGLRRALEAVSHLEDHQKVVQLMGEEASLFEEAQLAVSLGATTIFVDTGVPADIKPVVEALEAIGARDRVRVAFAGGVQHGDLDQLVRLGADALCIGRSIVDAPLLDMRLTVKGVS
jgi:nicotinate-nucleotide pyrophosphorylase (carboxylating)